MNSLAASDKKLRVARAKPFRAGPGRTNIKIFGPGRAGPGFHGPGRAGPIFFEIFGPGRAGPVSKSPGRANFKIFGPGRASFKTSGPGSYFLFLDWPGRPGPELWLKGRDLACANHACLATYQFIFAYSLHVSSVYKKVQPLN